MTTPDDDDTPSMRPFDLSKIDFDADSTIKIRLYTGDTPAPEPDTPPVVIPAASDTWDASSMPKVRSILYFRGVAPDDPNNELMNHIEDPYEACVMVFDLKTGECIYDGPAADFDKDAHP